MYVVDSWGKIFIPMISQDNLIYICQCALEFRVLRPSIRGRLIKIRFIPQLSIDFIVSDFSLATFDRLGYFRSIQQQYGVVLMCIPLVGLKWGFG